MIPLFLFASASAFSVRSSPLKLSLVDFGFLTPRRQPRAQYCLHSQMPFQTKFIIHKEIPMGTKHNPIKVEEKYRKGYPLRSNCQIIKRQYEETDRRKSFEFLPSFSLGESDSLIIRMRKSFVELSFSSRIFGVFFYCGTFNVFNVIFSTNQFDNYFQYPYRILKYVISSLIFYSFYHQNPIIFITRDPFDSPPQKMQQIGVNPEQSPSCKINSTDRSQMRKQILFMEQKYERIKKKLYQKKLIGNLTEPDIQEIGNIMNIIAMKYSQDGQNQVAEDWLRRALKHGEISQRVRIVTFNNMACVYKQANDLPMALFYINKAQKEADYFCLEMQDDKLLRVVTDCSLNLCAILSAMGQHYKALRAARKALAVLNSSKNLSDSYFNSLFPIVKFNEGVELERLRMYEEAEEAYLEAQKSPSVTAQLSERLARAIEQVRVSKEKARQKQKTIERSGKRIKLSLPKFCPSQNNNELPSTVTATAIKMPKPERKTFSSKKPESENEKNYRSIEPRTSHKPRPNKITIQNYSSAKSTAKTTSRTGNALASIQNF